MTMIAASLNNKAENRFPNLTIRDKLGNGVIALDAEKQQLLFLTKKPETASCIVIDLNNLNAFFGYKRIQQYKGRRFKKK
jgi:hypothetical protein